MVRSTLHPTVTAAIRVVTLFALLAVHPICNNIGLNNMAVLAPRDFSWPLPRTTPVHVQFHHLSLAPTIPTLSTHPTGF